MEKLRVFAFADEASPAISGQIAAMERNGLQGLEIRGVDGENVSGISLDKAREVRRRLEDAGLTVWSVGSPIGKIDLEKDDFAAHLDKLCHTLDVGRELGAKHLRMFSFYIPAGRTPESCRQQVVDQMGEMLRVGEGSGLLFCHENEKGAITATWPAAARSCWICSPRWWGSLTRPTSSSAARIPGKPGSCWLPAPTTCTSRMPWPTAMWCPRATALVR